jgi:hypothetical protein
MSRRSAVADGLSGARAVLAQGVPPWNPRAASQALRRLSAAWCVAARDAVTSKSAAWCVAAREAL